MRIVPFDRSHVAAAAELVAGLYREQRRLTPALSAEHEDAARYESLLRPIQAGHPSAAALEGDELVGFLTGYRIPEFLGRGRGAYAPIYAHAAAGSNRSLVYAKLYEALSKEWGADSCFTQAIGFYPGDTGGMDAWFGSGFGLFVIDALRGLSPVEHSPLTGYEIRRAGPDDSEAVTELLVELGRYLAQPPTFLPDLEPFTIEKAREQLADEEIVILLAFHRGRAVAEMRFEPGGHGTTYVVSGHGTAHVSSAYTRPEHRGQGLAAALLEGLVEVAKDKGYERIAVDFESANPLGRAFWLRHFQPVTYSLIRRVDDRVADSL